VGPLRLTQKLQAVLLMMSTSNSPFSSAAVYVAVAAGNRLKKELYKMKQLVPRIALMFALAFGGVAVRAQMPEGGGQMGHGPHGPMSADQRLQMMTKQLNLSSEQQQQIKPILENESQQMQTLRQDTSMPQADKMSKMQSIHANTASQIKPILNAEQQTKFDQMMSRHEHRGGPAGAYPNPGAAPGQGAPPPDQQQ
jgi:Spy/CpxP family protein refolding chaperone